MRNFIAGESISRKDLLKGKAIYFKKMIEGVLDDKNLDLDVSQKRALGQQLLDKYEIVLEDNDIIAFIQSVEGDKIGVLVFKEDEKYLLYLVSGTDEEIMRMTDDDSVTH